MEVGRVEFFPQQQATQTSLPSPKPAMGTVVVADRREVEELKRQINALATKLAVYEDRVDVLEDRTAIHNDILTVLEDTAQKHDTRLDHIEPTVEGLDQTIRDIARSTDVEMWDE